MTKFEYCYVACTGEQGVDGLYLPAGGQKVGKKSRTEILNELGAQGWEMVGFGNLHGASGHCIYFRRALLE